MLNVQNQYSNYLKEAVEMLNNSGIDIEIAKGLETTINKAELLIPFIGTFSAGKSTLLNLLLEKQALPIDITPETDLATELRYSEEERVEVITEDGHIERFSLERMQDIKSRSAEFNHLRMYLDSEILRSIAPLIPVDMPGFDSTLENHHKAISRYINQGSHYIVVTSAEDGGLTKSLERQLDSINSAGTSFSIFVSKTNLRSQEQVEDVIDNINIQVEGVFDEDPVVIPVGNVDGETLRTHISSIDPENLFKAVYSPYVKEEHRRLVENLNLSIASLEKTSDENIEAIDELREHVKKLSKKRDQLIRDARNKYSDQGVKRCSDAVERALMDESENLINIAISGNQDAFGKAVAEISQSSLMREVGRYMEDIEERVAKDLTVELNGLNRTMSGFAVGDEWADDFGSRAKTGLDMARPVLDTAAEYMSGKTGTVYRAVTTTLAVTTGVVFPVVEIIIIFLPDLLKFISRKSQEQEMRDKVVNDVIPRVKRDIEPKLRELVNEQTNALIKDISDEFESEIQEKEKLLSMREAQRQENSEERAARIEGLEKAREELRKCASKNVYGEVA